MKKKKKRYFLNQSYSSHSSGKNNPLVLVRLAQLAWTMQGSEFKSDQHKKKKKKNPFDITKINVNKRFSYVPGLNFVLHDKCKVPS